MRRILPALALAACGCGIPAQPLPPSLNLATQVADLTAERVGGAVVLRWTNPSRNTDKTLIRRKIAAEVCRAPSNAAGCHVVATLPANPGAEVVYSDVLPPELAEGAARGLEYRVRLRNPRGQTAGDSNAAFALAGAAPPAVTGLTAQNAPPGIKLQWQTSGASAAATVERITRTTLAGASAGKNPPEQHVLEVAAPALAAWDTTRVWGEKYRYQVQAITKADVEIDGKQRSVEMSGQPGPAAEVEARQVFAPAAPQGLVVAPLWSSEGKPAMDLHWEPNSEPQIAGYRVYRVEKFAHRGLERRQRISGDALVTATAFSDHDVTPGTVYRYTVVAVDTAGNTSAESAPAEDSALSGPE